MYNASSTRVCRWLGWESPAGLSSGVEGLRHRGHQRHALGGVLVSTGRRSHYSRAGDAVGSVTKRQALTGNEEQHDTQHGMLPGFMLGQATPQHAYL